MPDTDEAMPDAPSTTVLFRPSKKRRVYRQRATADSEMPPPSASPPTTTTDADADVIPLAAHTPDHDANDNDNDDDGEDSGGVVRARNMRKSRLRGVAFRSTTTTTPSTATAPSSSVVPPTETTTTTTSSEMILHDGGGAAPPPATVPARFTTATGLTTELHSRHMMEYIESGLAKRHNRLQPTTTTTLSSSSSSAAPTQANPLSTAPNAAPTSQPAALRGRILEVDLGDEVRSRNAEMTERAARRLQGDGGAETSDSGAERANTTTRRITTTATTKGETRGGGGRNRRGSDHAQRDKLVEEFLHENRLDVYDLNPATGAVESSGGTYFNSAELDLLNNALAEDGADLADDLAAADDRIAEQFRREFMEALQERQQLRRRKRKAASNAPPPPRGGGGAGGGAGPGPSSGAGGAGGGAGGPMRPGKKDDGEILRGPKLGGSRNDRAQMRDLLLANQKEKKPTLLGPGGRRR